MTEVFIIDEYKSSLKNGIGTYIQSLISCLEEQTEIRLNIIVFNVPLSHFKIQYKKRIRYLYFPTYGTRELFNNNILPITILRLHIPNSKENVFLVNHSPCYGLINQIKKTFNHSKVVFVVHNQGWTMPLMGNIKEFENIIHSKKRDTLRKYIKDYFREEYDIYSKSDIIICLSTATKFVLLNLYKIPEDKIHVILNACSMPKYEIEKQRGKEILGMRSDDILLIYSGRIVKTKGIEVLLQAFEEVFKNNKKVYLILAGDAHNLNNFLKFVPNSYTHIIFTGFLSHKDLAFLYHCSDIGILPSFYEQCSFTGIEMMNSKMLIISSDGLGLNEMFKDNEDALIAPIGNYLDQRTFVKNLFDVINKAITMPEDEREIIRNKAFEKAANYYSMNNMKKGYIELFNSIKLKG